MDDCGDTLGVAEACVAFVSEVALVVDKPNRSSHIV